MTLALITLAVLADVVAPTDPFASVAAPLSPPSRAHPLGTDDLGRDLLSGVVHGARTSFVVTLGVTALASLIGCISHGCVASFPGVNQPICPCSSLPWGCDPMIRTRLPLPKRSTN